MPLYVHMYICICRSSSGQVLADVLGQTWGLAFDQGFMERSSVEVPVPSRGSFKGEHIVYIRFLYRASG